MKKLFIALLFLSACVVHSASYPIVYLRAPRFGDANPSNWPEVHFPGKVDPGVDLVLLNPDGSEEVLFDCSSGGKCSATDPAVGLEAEWVYFSVFHDATQKTGQGTTAGADIYRIRLADKKLERLTHGQYFLNRPDSPVPLYAPLNLGVCPVPGGRVLFTSSRDGYEPPQAASFPTMQLYAMDNDGKNVEPTARMMTASMMHPVLLTDGTVMYASWESQGIRDDRKWAIWQIKPDGRTWAPLFSAFLRVAVFHFHGQMTDGTIVTTAYYQSNNNSAGTFFSIPYPRPTPAFLAADNQVQFPNKVNRKFKYPFAPVDMEVMTPWTTHDDVKAPCPGNVGDCADADRVGKVVHPSGAPGNQLLLTYSSGPANRSHAPNYDGGIYIAHGSGVIDAPSDLELVINDPAFNEMMPRAVVAYRDIYEQEPVELPWLPNDGLLHAELPAGTPFGIVGTSSVYKRESFPAADNNCKAGSTTAAFDCLDPFNTTEKKANWNWGTQGGDVGKYSNTDIEFIRIVMLEPNPYGEASFDNVANEKHRILGDIAVRNVDGAGNPILDLEGNPDTSWAAKIPADVSFTFHLLDKDKRNLAVSQTWHQVRPGEVRVDCGGCHAHSQQPLLFEDTVAGQPGYQVADLTGGATDVEYYRDVSPLLSRVVGSLPGFSFSDSPERIYQCLADDIPGDCEQSVAGSGKWRSGNASANIRSFQSRRSRFGWEVADERLDGWSNSDHPTGEGMENFEDLDYDNRLDFVPALTQAEKEILWGWIDLGAARDTGDYFLDTQKPSLTIPVPMRGLHPAPPTLAVVSASDAYSGLESVSLEGSWFSGDVPLVETSAGVFEGQLPQASGGAHVLTARAVDSDGNISQIERTFEVGGTIPPPVVLFSDGFESGDTGAWQKND